MCAYVRVGGGVECVEGFDAWEFRFEDSALSAAFVADIDLDGEGVGEEVRVGHSLFCCMCA